MSNAPTIDGDKIKALIIQAAGADCDALNKHALDLMDIVATNTSANMMKAYVEGLKEGWRQGQENAAKQIADLVPRCESDGEARVKAKIIRWLRTLDNLGVMRDAIADMIQRECYEHTK